MEDWLIRLSRNIDEAPKAVAYLSAEYLLGPQLINALVAEDLEEPVREGLASLGLDLEDLAAAEPEPGLGNGGLGRLAACYVDSLATMRIPAIGYGIRYEYGIFRQTFVDNRQVEVPDKWLAMGNPWEFAHPEMAQPLASAVMSKGPRTRTAIRFAWGAGTSCLSCSLQLPRARLRRRRSQHAAPVVGAVAR